MALMLVDTGWRWPPDDDDPGPRRRRRRPSEWRLPLLLVLGFAMVLVSGVLGAVAAYVALIAACVLIGLALGGLRRGTFGLREHRQ